MGSADLWVALTAVVTGVASLTRQAARPASRRRLRLVFAVETLNLVATAVIVVARPVILIASPLATVIVFSLAEWCVAGLDLRHAPGRDGR